MSRGQPLVKETQLDLGQTQSLHGADTLGRRVDVGQRAQLRHVSCSLLDAGVLVELLDELSGLGAQGQQDRLTQ